MRRVRRLMRLLPLLLVLTTLVPAAIADTGAEKNNAELVSAAVNLINADRGSNGVQPVQQSQALSKVAQTYADYLLRTGFFGHVDPFGRNPEQRARYLGVTVPVSENLAWESSTFEPAQTLLRRAESGMLNEPPNQPNHRFNILNPQSRFVGVGVAQSGDKVVLVQEFSSSEP